MGQNPGDKKPQPSLELPSFPGFGRRKKRAERSSPAAGEQASTPPPATSDADVEETAELVPAPSAADQSVHGTQPLAPAEPQRRAAAEPQRRAPRRSRSARTRRSFSLPGRAAAALTGLVVGVAGGAATYGVLAGCEAVRGVSTCGGGPGFFLLVAILALMVLLGAGVLKVLGVAAPGSTSFLAVGVMTVVVMLALLDLVDSPWMFVVVPTLGVASYLLAHWVTTRFDAATPQRPDWT